ncbi:hypothetical protein [Amycolatopsis sp. NPDC004079]|uniref:hypothetical protein n=1 Tax=Amycolatopsis sp. NPDC004079 TaxID=3154549 RepID=UPI0033ADCE0A
MLKGKSAVELADALETMESFPHNTGGLSMLDEATLAFGGKSAEIGEAQRTFSQARHAHKSSYSSASGGYSDDQWHQVMQAAHRLAALLRALGDVRIARCSRPASWGECGLPLDEDGQCRSSLGHADSSIDTR